MAESDLLVRFGQFLSNRTAKTTKNYLSTAEAFLGWAMETTSGKRFAPALLTSATIAAYLEHLRRQGHAPGTLRKTFAILKVFCRWAMAEGMLAEDPTATVARPIVHESGSHPLSPQQRHVLKLLVQQMDSARMRAIFALAYWTGLRVHEIAGLRLGQCNVSQRTGEITLLDAQGAIHRTLDLHPKARQALYRYLYETPDTAPDARDRGSRYVFTGQRAAWLRSQNKADHLSARGIEYLWTQLKTQASVSEWSLIQAIRLEDLRQDWAYRASEAGWSREEIAVYAGSRDGWPAPGRDGLPDREQIKARLQHLKG